MSKSVKIGFLMIPFLLIFCQIVQAEKIEKRTWQDEIIYFIMVDRFHNGDPTNDYEVNTHDQRAYHGGDLAGVTKKLDYLKSLGITSIWLTPIVDNEDKGYHGYWTKDFYKVEEHFGSLEDLKLLVKEAHQRQIKVILDLVVNHTGYQHPWLNDPTKKEWFHEEMNILSWDNQDQVENGRLAGLPDLAQENAETENYLLEMAKWWIEETDIDGYRLDTVKHVPKWFWEKFAKEVKSVKEDFFLIGEVWHNDPRYIAEYNKVGIQAFVDYPFYDKVLG
jgi:alpha-amylase